MDNNIGDQLEKELKLLRSEYWKQWDSENPSPRLQLEYASLLSCSPDKANIREALDLFNELIEIGYNRPDCLYQLSIAHLKLGDHALARQQIEQLLRMVRLFATFLCSRYSGTLIRTVYLAGTKEFICPIPP
eukprot:GHVS01010879.1.p1 GENE.GHVS01010879.1~~GHVS01010879.1.p1  ORF type:complete len:132 (+),score=14.35 GHVS01010879.1:176-571(+)